MMVSLLGHRLAELEPTEAALVLNAFYDKIVEHLLKLRKAKAAISDPKDLIAAIGEEKGRLIYLASLELGLNKVGRLFTDLPPHKKGLSGYDTEEDAKMEFITLGERRALSKGWIKDKLDRLLSDPDPMVIANLLNNPRITEKEIIKIAAKRPNSPKIIRLISTHRRWGMRYAVKKALVQNPYTPPRISLGLLESLFLQDLKEAAKDGGLHPQVRHAAKERLEEKE
ncbi:MAG: hypothetical protein HY026_09670 [Deltaproteobacteria bacterium]|nr:hypothetical protein [Deltaproteobacteria bacterium]